LTSAITAFALERLEALFDNALGLDPGTRESLKSLAGKSLAIHCTFPSRSIRASVDASGAIRLSLDAHGADVALSGSAVSMAALIATASRRVSFANSGVTIAGDQEVLRRLSAVLENLDFDWEAAIASVIGDVPAHLMASTVRQAVTWQKSAAARAASGIGEYLREESGLTLSRAELEPWSKAVRHLTFDSDRLAARLAKLRAHIEATNR